MKVEVGERYNTRGGNIAVVTDDIKKFSPIFSLKGYVHSKQGEMIREICMWTNSGDYELGHETMLDIISKL